MTSISESDSLDNSNSRRNRYDFKLLLKIIDTLGQFENNYNKKFNFTKMAKCLRIPNLKIDEIIDNTIYIKAFTFSFNFYILFF